MQGDTLDENENDSLFKDGLADIAVNHDTRLVKSGLFCNDVSCLRFERSNRLHFVNLCDSMIKYEGVKALFGGPSYLHEYRAYFQLDISSVNMPNTSSEIETSHHVSKIAFDRYAQSYDVTVVDVRHNSRPRRYPNRFDCVRTPLALGSI